ncbi:MAG: 1-deoxy-D-xylulose 5-phosphate reductoisomerase [Armatimonadota bacterium]|nr:MAG: 1-deoxy-D-xylulose 5-phosphate reductoisomerase [Armatimonadota bacterium]
MRSEQTVRSISVLGSTGSIGTQVLDVVERLQGRVRVRSLAGGRNIELLAQQVRRFRPHFVVASDSEGAAALREHPACAGVEVLCGQEGMCRIASDPEVETVVVGVQGFAGLRPTIAAAEAGKQIAIASKEVLVAAKEPVRRAVREGGAKLIPVDSEHSAIFQCLTGEPEGSVERIILTASGGPFARASREQMASITPAMALAHPTWKMGQKVTIDSATLMNKGLEILEAEALFGVDPQNVDVVIHPRSIVHSLVRFKDGSVKAQLGVPDMRLPIQYALLYPERVDTALPQLDLLTCGPLEFHPPDEDRFPCLRLARVAARRGGTIPAVMSAADDVAVEAFLDGRIAFLDIPEIIEDVMARADNEPAEELETIIRADYRAREMAREAVEKHSRAAVR